jgi:hypothetical protein
MSILLASLNDGGKMAVVLDRGFIVLGCHTGHFRPPSLCRHLNISSTTATTPPPITKPTSAATK